MSVRTDIEYALSFAGQSLSAEQYATVCKRLQRARDAIAAIDAQDLALQNAEKAADCFDYARAIDLLTYNS